VRKNGKTARLTTHPGSARNVSLTPPSDTLMRIRRDAYEQIGRSVEAVDEVIFLADRKRHARRIRDELYRLSDTCALLDVIGWTAEERSLGLQLELIPAGRQPPLSSERRAGQQLAATVRAIRKAQGLSIETLALQAGIHPTYLSQIERNLRNPTYTKIYMLGCALKVRAGEIIRRAEAAGHLQQQLERGLAKQPEHQSEHRRSL